MSIVTDFIRLDKEYGALIDSIKYERKSRSPLPILVSGLCEGASDAAFASIVSDIKALDKDDNGTVLILLPDEKSCVRLTSFLNKQGLVAGFYMARDLTFYNITASHEYEHERLSVLSGILDRRYDAVVTTPDAALGFTIPPAKLTASRYVIEYGETLIDPQEFSEFLVSLGYVRVDLVDAAGQFASRGGIFDVYPSVARYTDVDGNTFFESAPFRIELFGDEIDRMEAFDPETQRMTASLDRVEFTPPREILLSSDSRARLKEAVSAQMKKATEESAIREIGYELSAIDAGVELNFLDKYISLIYPEMVCLLDYFAKGTTVILKGTAAIYEKIKASAFQLEQTVKSIIEGGTVSEKYAEYSKTADDLKEYLAHFSDVHFDSLGHGLSGERLGGMFNFKTKHMISYGDNFSILREDIDAYKTASYKICVLAENESAAKNISALLIEKGISAICESSSSEFSITDIPKDRVLVSYKENLKGFELVAPRVAVLSTLPDGHEGAYDGSALRKRKRLKKGTERILSYNDLDVGDFVVHEIHGIGQYMGIQNIKADGVSRDYITIRYAGTDKLFLPIEKMDMITKYIGAHSDDGKVKLSKFGGTEWNKAKAKAKAAVKNIAKDLILLYAERERREGFAFPEDDASQMEFDGAFEYEETDGQTSAIEDIKKDMELSRPMDRLLCGDVGFGKTEVAMRAAYKAVLGGKQVAVLVPTTILALQHFQTFTSRMRAFGVSVDMISRFRTPKQQAHSLRKLKRGETDIIIGTHRLIGKDIEFKDLGLLIVDEEQRFGVSQKEKLKQLTFNVDVLTLTATPIPRTLNMALSGIRDISVLDEAPGDRLPVQTYVLDHDELVIHDAIRRELRRGGQVFYLYNFVDGIDLCATKLANAIPEARITVAHGKMEKEELEDIWSDMLAGNIDILVSTTIIETGIDVPMANTLIVENAHRLGLSQLHQLRGRVGRSSRRAYAYFTFPKGMALTEIATKRLEAIRDYAEFGAGFKIAIRDLEIRGAGNLLGAEQHGHLDAVGYELYIKLLNEAVLEEKGVVVPQTKDCTLSLRVNAFIAEKYIPYATQRMDLYRRIAMIETEDDKKDIIDELIDRFGEPPKPTLDLLTVSLIRSAALRCDILNIVEEVREVRIYPSNTDFDIWAALFYDPKFKGRARIIGTGNPCVVITKKSGEDVLSLLLSLFGEYERIRSETKEESNKSV